tara:strand:- start:311 stop:418 length:108 start_codon:yes stop_codon:yes gene_type:complete
VDQSANGVVLGEDEVINQILLMLRCVAFVVEVVID